MRFLKLSNDLIMDTNIKSNDFRIYAYLLLLYNEEKKCAYPSMKNISEKVNISIATVKRSIKRLEELKYIVIEKRKTIAGNYNAYTRLKHLIKNITSKEMPQEVCPYSTDHKNKISLVLKYVNKLTEKQMFVIGDMDIEVLKKALFRFRKSTKTYSFSFLLECYYTECSISGDIRPSFLIQRYCKKRYMEAPREILEVKNAMIEDGIFDEEMWYKNLEMGI